MQKKSNCPEISSHIAWGMSNNDGDGAERISGQVETYMSIHIITDIYVQSQDERAIMRVKFPT